jgi:16S rRNA (guanine527-N7)-methyltransferase
MIHDELTARNFVASLCDSAAMERLDRLAILLAAENGRQNLVAKDTMPTIWQRHIADSAQLLRFVSEPAGFWLDLGTGAGFPGLVAAAMRPNWQVKLVESRKRRVEWLSDAKFALNLAQCEVIGIPLERVDSFPAGVISARAFAPMPRLLDLSRRFSTGDTLWLLPKGRSAAQDLASLPDRLQNMFHVEQSVTDNDAGIIVGKFKQEARR